MQSHLAQARALRPFPDAGAPVSRRGNAARLTTGKVSLAARTGNTTTSARSHIAHNFG